ncbi:hypothetical protein HK097_005915, partial [Rhizophlyctis rosea]
SPTNSGGSALGFEETQNTATTVYSQQAKFFFGFWQLYTGNPTCTPAPLGQDPRKAEELTRDIATELSERREQDLELVRILRKYAAEQRIRQHQQEHGEELPEPRESRAKDLVWYYSKQQDEGLRTERKILPRWNGPYHVELAAGKGSNYWVDLEGNSVKL